MYPEDYFNTVEPVETSIVLHDPHRYVNPMTDGITLTAGKYYRIFATMVNFYAISISFYIFCCTYCLK